jgi:hypothetical protein
MESSGPQWSPDPYGRHELRYFDGSAWTQHVADAGDVSVDWLPIREELREQRRLTSMQRAWADYQVGVQSSLRGAWRGTAFNAAPTWATDPLLRGEARYWDGSRWTEYCRTGGEEYNELTDEAIRRRRPSTMQLVHKAEFHLGLGLDSLDVDGLGLAAWHGNIALDLALAAVPTATPAPRGSKFRRPQPVVPRNAQPAVLLSNEVCVAGRGRLASGVLRRVARAASNHADVAAGALCANFMLATTAGVLGGLAHVGFERRARRAWCLELRVPLDADDVLAEIADAVTQLAFRDLENFYLLSVYASYYNWVPVLDALNRLGYHVPEPTMNDAWACEVLGTYEEASPWDVAAAFHRTALESHPDRLDGVSPHDRRDAYNALITINRAYRHLLTRPQQESAHR